MGQRQTRPTVAGLRETTKSLSEFQGSLFAELERRHNVDCRFEWRLSNGIQTLLVVVRGTDREATDAALTALAIKEHGLVIPVEQAAYFSTDAGKEYLNYLCKSTGLVGASLRAESRLRGTTL